MPLAMGEPQSRPGALRRARLPEAIEEVRLILGGDPGSCIADPEEHVVSRRAAPTVMHPPGGVNLMALPMRLSNTWRSRSRSAQTSGSSATSSRSSSDPEAPPAPVDVDGIGRDLRGASAVWFDREVTGLDPGHVQQVLDEAVHPRRRAFDQLAGFPGPALERRCVRSKEVPP